MSLSTFTDKRTSATPDAMAPDGSEVRILCGVAGGGTALFTLPPGGVAWAVVHATVDEIWYVVRGRGRIWRLSEGREAVTELAAGASLTIPVGTHFQFRNDGDEPLDILGVTIPPWPGEEEAQRVAGKWVPTL